MGKKYTTFKVNLEGLESISAWYTIVTQYNYEQKVTNDINKIIKDNTYNGLICDVFSGIKEIKEETVNAKGEKKIKIKNEKILSNYVFVKTKMSVEIWAMLTNITGVSAILCTSGRPISTSENKINNMKLLLTGENNNDML